MVSIDASRRATIGQVASNSDAVEVGLSEGEVFSTRGDARGTRLEAVAGKFWVTQTGDAQDYLLRAGQTFVVSSPGKVVVMGIPKGSLRVKPARPTALKS